ncbi:MAG: GNAT family N-acetyltransferase [Actinobacteria bacterium]|nr:GNAT family N-acetyltransferase [Actinomycetota bacterium]
MNRPTDAELGRAVGENLHELFRSMSRLLPGGELAEGERVSLHHASPTNPMFKGVWAARAGADGLDVLAEEAERWLLARGAPFGFWWQVPGDASSDLAPVLAARGWAPFDLDAPCQVAGLDELDWSALDRVPDGLAIERALNEDAVRSFGPTFSGANGVPDWAGLAWVDATLAIGIESAPWQVYVARLDGRPVGTTLLFSAAGIASVFGVATLPQERGQGIGAAITLGALRDARDAGERHAGLFATDLGAPVYRRIGFRDVPGCAVSRWLWRADS